MPIKKFFACPIFFMSNSPEGAEDKEGVPYWGKGVLNPDIVLKDKL